MANFGVEDGALTDACFPVFSAMPKLRYLLLDGNIGINGSGLSALQSCKLDLLTLTAPGWMMPACSRRPPSPSSPTSRSTTPLLLTRACCPSQAAAASSRWPMVQFTKEQMEHFSQLQREKAKKPAQLDEQAAEECRRVLSAFFAEMTEWEQYMEQAGFEDAEAVPRCWRSGRSM